MYFVWAYDAFNFQPQLPSKVKLKQKEAEQQPERGQ